MTATMTRHREGRRREENRRRPQRQQNRQHTTTRRRSFRRPSIVTNAVPAWHPSAPETRSIKSHSTSPPWVRVYPGGVGRDKARHRGRVGRRRSRKRRGLNRAADMMTQESMAFAIRHTSGLVCVSLEDERADALHLPLWWTRKRTGITEDGAYGESWHDDEHDGNIRGRKSGDYQRSGE